MENRIRSVAKIKKYRKLYKQFMDFRNELKRDYKVSDSYLRGLTAKESKL